MCTVLAKRKAVPPTGNTNNCFLPWMVYSQHSGMFLLKSFLFLCIQSVNRGKAKINPFAQNIVLKTYLTTT